MHRRPNAPLPKAINLFTCPTCNKGYARQLEYEAHLSSYDHLHLKRMIDMRAEVARAEQERRPQRKRVLEEMIPMPLDPKKHKFSKAGGDKPLESTRFKKVGVTIPGNAPEPAAEKKPAGEAKVVADVEVKIADESPVDDKKEVAELHKQGETAKPQESSEERLKKVKAAIAAINAKIKTTSESPAHAPGTTTGSATPDDMSIKSIESDDGGPINNKGAKNKENKPVPRMASEEITWEEYDFTRPTNCDHAKCAGCKTDGIFDPDPEWDL